MSSVAFANKNSSVPSSETKAGARSAAWGLRVGEPNDAYEQEADRVADEVLAGDRTKCGWSLSRMSIGAPLQRKCSCGGAEGECEECKKKTLQRKAADTATPSAVPPIVLEALRSPGEPLNSTTRTFFESRFGADFGRVRLHADAKAAGSAAAVNALAYTVGSDIVLGPERRNLQSADTHRVLAHELAHTVQQSRGGRPPLLNPHDSLEHDADRAAAAAEIGSAVVVSGNCAPGLARQTPPTTAGPAPSAPARPGRIISERSAPDGKVIDMEVGSAVDRLGLEQTLPSGTQVNLEGWQRAHQVGPGLGAESEVGIRYAPPDVNLQYQNSGIERFIREFNRNKAPGVRLLLRTVTETHPRSLRLKSISYRLSAARGEARPTILFESGIEIENATRNPRITLDKPEILGDWKEFLAPGKSMEPPGSASGSAGGGTAHTEAAPGTAQADPSVKEGTGAKPAGASGSAPETQPRQPPASTAVRVGTKIEVTNTVKNANGSTVSEVEYNFGENLKQINEGAPTGAEIPSRIAVRVTQNSEGVITSVESLSGQPQALVDALAQRTLAPGLAGEAGGAAQGAAAGARRAALLFKGLKIGGWAAFGIITGYQLYKATPAQRPRVLAGAGGGLAGGIATTYLVCNLALDIETAGWGLVICGFIAGGAGGMVGTKVAEDVYDEATATDLDRALHQLDGKDPNERTVFNIIVGKLGDTSNCIDANFVNKFISTIPPHLQDSETVLLAAQLAAAAIAPPSSVRSTEKPPKQKGTECPGCHGRSQESLQPSFQRLDRMSYEAILAAPTCSSILGAALSVLKTAVGQLPRYYRAPGDISHHPEPGTPTVTPRPTHDPNAIPSEKQQMGTGNCPGGCHTPSGGEKSLIDAKKPATDAERIAMMNWLQSQKKPAATGNAHATPPGVKLPASQGFPSVEEQQGHQPARKDDKLGGLSSFGTGSKGEMTDADRQKLIDFVNAGKK
jgi:hypothetical protein